MLQNLTKTTSPKITCLGSIDAEAYTLCFFPNDLSAPRYSIHMWEIIREFSFAEVAPNWAYSHIQVPTPFVMGNKICVYYATRDSDGKSHLLSFGLDIEKPTKIIEREINPLIDLGQPGTFDEDGVMVSSVIEANGDTMVFYTGWQRSHTVPYNTSAGLLIRKNSSRNFQRYSIGPILGRSVSEPFYTNTPFVYLQEDKFHMIYGSGKEWSLIGDRYEPTYFLRKRQSTDGLEWGGLGEEFLQPISKEESTVRATRYNSGKTTKILFSSRFVRDFRGGSGSYAICEVTEPCSSEVNNLRSRVSFTNLGQFSNQNMLAYPAIFSLDVNYLLFNGSSFGKNSIFLAREES